MAPLPKYLLWLDFETTGLDPATTTIVEVFWEVTDTLMDPIAEGRGMHPTPELLDMDDFVRGMHATSRLFDDARCHVGHDIEQSLLYLMMVLDDIGEPVPLAGSGVGHFDRLVLAAQYPKLAAMLCYWSLDTGVLRRAAQLAGYADLLLPDAEPVHRAEADVRRAQAEYRNHVCLLSEARFHLSLGGEQP